MTFPKLTPGRVLAGILGLFVFIGIIVVSVNWFQARGYDKARKEFEVQSKAWDKERAGAIARAEEAEKRQAALEPKAAAFDALVGQKKAIDAGLAKKVEEVSTNAANAEAMAETVTDCGVRANRVCALLSSNNIKHDCAAIRRETCGPR